QSQFLNGLIQRKAFSWTRVFEDLEPVMPPNLHVVSLRPELNDQNQMQLDMRVACDTRAAAVELVHRMEDSKRFQGTELVSEGQGSEAGSGMAASVVSIYVRARRTGAQSNAGLGKLAAQAEDCDWGDAGGRCGCAGRPVLAAGRFGGFADAAIERTATRTAKEDPRSGTAARHGQEDRAGQGSNQRVLQGPFCRERLRSGQRTGEAGVREWGSDPAGEIHERGS